MPGHLGFQSIYTTKEKDVYKPRPSIWPVNRSDGSSICQQNCPSSGALRFLIVASEFWPSPFEFHSLELDSKGSLAACLGKKQNSFVCGDKSPTFPPSWEPVEPTSSVSQAKLFSMFIHEWEDRPNLKDKSHSLSRGFSWVSCAKPLEVFSEFLQAIRFCKTPISAGSEVGVLIGVPTYIVLECGSSGTREPNWDSLVW